MADEPDIEKTLSKKIGPLPVGVWVLAVGGGLVFAWYLRTRSSGAAEEGTGEEVPGRNTDTMPGVGGSAGGSYPGDNTGTGAGPARPLTNEEWYTLASQKLLDTHEYNELAIDTALKAYLEGSRQLTPAEAGIVSRAIRLVGPPPVPTPTPPSGTGGTQQPDPDGQDPGQDPPVRTPPPDTSGTPTPPASKPGDKWHTVASGDNLSKIAQRYYGNADVDANRNKIYRTNSAVIEYEARKRGRTDSGAGQYIYPGTRLLIPGPFPSSSSSSSSSSGSTRKAAAAKTSTKSSKTGTASGDLRSTGTASGDLRSTGTASGVVTVIEPSR